MTHFITTNALIIVTMLGGLLVAFASLAYVALRRRGRQHAAIRRLLELTEMESRFACDAVTSKFVHDLNNIILVLSMQSERRADPQESDILSQLIAEARELVERSRARMTASPASSSDLCQELRVATELLRDASYSKVAVAVADSVPRVVTVPGGASDVHVLLLAMVRAARAGGGPDSPSLTISRGRDASLPVDDEDSGWVNIATVVPEGVSADDATGLAFSRTARRLSGETVFPDPESGRFRLAVSLPVIGD